MTKITIVVNYTGRKGGGALYAYEMTKGLIENGCCVYAIIARDIENVNEWTKLELEELILIPTYSNKINYIINTLYFTFIGLKKLSARFKKKKVDAIYVPMIQPWTGLINSIFKSPQKIITLHDPKPHSGSSNYFNRICKKVTMEANDIVILSENFRKYTSAKYNKEIESIHVIPHGVFDYYKNIQNTDYIVEYDKDKINFLFFGRITKYKGLHTLAQAYDKLSKEFDDVTLTVVGNGDFEEYKQAYSGLRNVTIVNRWIKDEEVGSFFKGNNIVTVLPYTDATQSGVIPIAMVYKSLVIASNTGGLAEQVENGKTGYLVEPGNQDDLYKIMKYVKLNYISQNEIIDNAMNFITPLTWRELSKKVIEIVNGR